MSTDPSGDPVSQLTPSSSYRHYRPLAEAADEYVRWAQTPHQRIYTGIDELDREMRGVAPGEMLMIQGYSHSGKTLLLLEMLKANRNKRIIYFVPDEPRTLVLIKLACVIYDMNAVDLEQRVAAGDTTAIQLLRDTADECFPQLAVYDETMTLSTMEAGFNEASDVWGAEPHAVVFDYLELLQGGGEDVPSKSNALKSWGRRHNVPLLILHQTSRSAGADGRRMTISSGAFGGEQQATHIVGVRRRKFELEAQLHELRERMEGNPRNPEMIASRIDETEYLLRIHQHTLTVNLVKNKRPGGGLLPDMDFEINNSGRLSRLSNGDLPYQYRMEAA